MSPTSLHTKQLGRASGLGTGQTTIYTCPTGITTIIKEALFRNNTGTANYCVYEIDFTGGGSIARRIQLAAIGAAGEYVRDSSWTVLQAGDSVKVNMSAGTGAVLLSGTELND